MNLQKELVIQGTVIPAGESKELALPIAKLPTHTQIEMPVFVYRGKQAGPVLLITSGIHGDEVNGTEMLRRMMRMGHFNVHSGSVIAMPIVNVYGFLHKSRALPDGKDMNRSFPGSKSGSLARRLAHTLIQEVLQHVDYVIDLHTGGARRTNFPQVRLDFKRENALELAKAFGAPFLMNSGELKGSFRQTACKLGKSFIVYEGGESLRFDEYAIRQGMHGILRAMKHLGMKDSEILATESKILRDNSWLRAKIAGLFCPVVNAGDFVESGQFVAELGDPYGEMVHKVLAPQAGYIIGLNNEPIVNAGDALMNISWE